MSGGGGHVHFDGDDVVGHEVGPLVKKRRMLAGVAAGGDAAGVGPPGLRGVSRAAGGLWNATIATKASTTVALGTYATDTEAALGELGRGISRPRPRAVG
jgi:hypothetical protein